jgi:hypothetical protein
MNREPQRVPPHLLPSLKFDFQTSSFEGHGLSIVDVRIRRAVTTQSGPAVEGGPAALEGTPPELSDHVTVSIPPPGKPGRPQLPADFEQELRRHFEAGEMANTFGQELLYLYAWGKSRRLKTSKGDPWALSTIGNNLRTIYRELKAQKTHPD